MLRSKPANTASRPRIRATNTNITVREVKVPDGKVLFPGVVTHASNIVEHPELIAERILRFANWSGART